jgi:predicted ATPase/class 3 adenylate cyclase
MATVTFLFSDIEGSTRLWQDHPGTMPAALARHDEIVSGAVTAAGGTVFKHTGDGVAAVFGSAPAALTAATDIHRRLTPENDPEVGPIRVRIGVHSGEAESRGDDWFGLTVNRTARIMAAGHGGQTLLSGATAELVADAGFDLRDLGEHRLSGLQRPDRIYQLCAPGLSTDFPSLATAPTTTIHLPDIATEPIGREQLLAHVRSRLRAGPLVTLTGVGGVGKTTIALAAAFQPPEGTEGVWFCDLVPITDPERVPAAVAASVGLPADDATRAAERVAQWIGDRPLLLVIDNCEHVLEEVARLVEQLTRVCPGLTILATSRAPLGVAAEQVIPVSPLESDAAVELLRRRAEAAGAGGFDERRSAELCARLDRLPLAIELAAARLSHLSVDDILTRLDERFRLLSVRRGDPRHATLLATIDWSYQLLEPDEQAMLRAAGVFTSLFDLAAAAAVWGGDEYDAIDLVGSLVSKSLLIAEVDGAGSTGYRLLETVRAFAHERADELGESDALAQAHAEHYLRQSLGQPPVAGDRQPWTYVLGQDRSKGFQDANRPQAVSWLVAHDRLVDAARFAARLLLVNWYRPDAVEGILRRPEVAEMLDDRDERALYLAASALQANMVGRWDENRVFAEAALALEPDPHTAAIAAALAAQMAAIRGDDRVGEFVAAGLQRLPAEAVELRQFLRERHCDDIIRRRLDDGIRLLDELHEEGSVWATFELLMCCVLIGRDPDPLIAGMAEQQLTSQFGYRAPLARAFVAAAAGNADEAIPLLAEAGATALRFRGSLFEHDVLVGCAILAEAQGRYEEASRMLAAVGGSTRTPASFVVYRWCRDRVRDRLPRERVEALRAEMSGRDAASVLSEELARLGRER